MVQVVAWALHYQMLHLHKEHFHENCGLLSSAAEF